jgi:hypothetical protein
MESALVAIVGAVGAILSAALAASLTSTWRARIEARKATEAITQAESRIEAEPEKAKPAWDLARVTLESYFNRNLSQIASIFWLSVFVMIIGFAVIVVGIFESITKPATVTAGAIATAAGIIIEFIGATFLFVYRSTIQQAGDPRFFGHWEASISIVLKPDGVVIGLTQSGGPGLITGDLNLGPSSPPDHMNVLFKDTDNNINYALDLGRHWSINWRSFVVRPGVGRLVAPK